MRQKTETEKEKIRQNWTLRCILRTIQNLLPEGYVTTNSKPVKKELRRKDSCGKSIYWSSWCKKDGVSYLACYDGKKLKIISEQDLKTSYDVKSIA